MTNEELINQAESIIDQGKKHLSGNFSNYDDMLGFLSEATDFLRIHAGSESVLFKQLDEFRKKTRNFRNDITFKQIHTQLTAFIRYVKSGMLNEISVKRKAQIDVVSDFLMQAQILLDTKNVHPAAPAMVIGSALEEFLRNWVEQEGYSLGNKKPSIDAYAKTLKENDKLTTQDMKDITAWGGIRNAAAHGKWDEVSETQRIRLMLEGVNLFMRQNIEK